MNNTGYSPGCLCSEKNRIYSRITLCEYFTLHSFPDIAHSYSIHKVTPVYYATAHVHNISVGFTLPRDVSVSNFCLNQYLF